jgi:transposase
MAKQQDCGQNEFPRRGPCAGRPHAARRARPGLTEVPLAAPQSQRDENLLDEQHLRLCDLLRYNLKTVRPYLLKEAFQQLWDNSPAWAGKLLDEWCRQTMRSRIKPMKKIARSVRQYRN